MSKSDRRAYAKTVTAPPEGSKAALYPDVSDATNTRALNRYEERQKFVGIADSVAESLIWFRNWKWPGSDARYPHNPDMRFVDRYYPYAKGGPLLVDEPRDERQVLDCYSKQRILKALGFRHIVLEPEGTLSDALEQLGKL